MQTVLKNWKTSLAGLVTFLMGCPALITALHAYAAGQPVDWHSVMVSVAMTAVGVGLGAAKDGSTHSTQAETYWATQQAQRKG